jgi:hypothetical protein
MQWKFFAKSVCSATSSQIDVNSRDLLQPISGIREDDDLPIRKLPRTLILQKPNKTAVRFAENKIFVAETMLYLFRNSGHGNAMLRIDKQIIANGRSDSIAPAVLSMVGRVGEHSRFDHVV